MRFGKRAAQLVDGLPWRVGVEAGHDRKAVLWAVTNVHAVQVQLYAEW